jgi:hypothetical protein
MTLFQIEELTSYWTQHPPVHLLVAAYLGLGKNSSARLPPASMGRGKQPSSDSGSLLAQLGPGFGAGDVNGGLSPVIVDFAELRLRAEIPDEVSAGSRRALSVGEGRLTARGYDGGY